MKTAISETVKIIGKSIVGEPFAWRITEKEMLVKSKVLGKDAIGIAVTGWIFKLVEVYRLDPISEVGEQLNLGSASEEFILEALKKRDIIVGEHNLAAIESLGTDILICTNEELKKELDRLIDAAPGIVLTSKIPYIRKRAQR